MDISKTFFKLKIPSFIAVLVFLVSCNSAENNVTTTTNDKALFSLLSPKDSGLDFTNQLNDDPLGENNVLSFAHYYNGAGVAIGDINNDGLPDVFLSGNEVPNKLFLNKGNLKFEDISQKANINENKKWSTGATMADVNGDGHLDIYVCQYGPSSKWEERQNLLFINNGDLTFSEKGKEYGLNDGNESTHAAFFDYDKDGDLDCYVLNESKYALIILNTVYEDLKKKENLEAASGNLFRNDNGKFTKVTEEAGVLKYGYGLGLVISDMNNDGWPDIYVANDYSVPDFMYINNGDGTFTDEVKKYTRQVSFYGMGADIADINNDGLSDIAVVDMAADDHIRSKTLMASMDTEGFRFYVEKMGYQYQYMFNSFQLNNGNGTYSNIANMLNAAKSDWSWAALLVDLNNDGNKDYFISNGFRRYARDNDFRNMMKKTREDYQGSVPASLRKEIYAQIPELKLPNIVYKNDGNLGFEIVTKEWGLDEPSYSNGTSYADLDLDGDLDLVISNVDQKTFLYRNNAVENKVGNYLRFKFEGTSPATPIEGAKITLRYGDEIQFQELITSRGYMGAVEPVVHFGMGTIAQVKEAEVVWPSGKIQKLNDIPTNQVVTLYEKDASLQTPATAQLQQFPIEKVDAAAMGIDFKHTENYYDDFASEILLPHRQSTLGPKISVADTNADGFEDFFVGGASGQAGQLFLQNANGTFKPAPAIETNWIVDTNSEDMEPLFFDADGNGSNELYIVSGGGGDLGKNNPYLQDRFYITKGNGAYFKVQNAFPEMFTSGNVAKAADFDKDGDLDIFVGGAAIPRKYPYPSRSYLLRNDSGKFTDVTEEAGADLVSPGIVKDFVWTDLNNDSYPDLVLVGEWMPISFYLNENGKFRNATEEYGTADQKGWWYSIAEADIDNDGDKDLIAGNIGMNSKFHASHKKPFNVFSDDFDSNGSNDIVLSKEYKGKLVPTRGRQCSSEQMPFIKEKFPTFKEFAHAGVEDILGKDKIEASLHLQATTFESIVLINNDNSFDIQALPRQAQIAPINGIIAEDIDGDQNVDLIIAGNIYNTEVETPRYDAGNGLVLKGNGDGTFKAINTKDSGFFAPGNVKDIALLNLADGSGKLILVGNNDGPVEVFKISNGELLSMK